MQMNTWQKIHVHHCTPTRRIIWKIMAGELRCETPRSCSQTNPIIKAGFRKVNSGCEASRECRCQHRRRGVSGPNLASTVNSETLNGHSRVADELRLNKPAALECGGLHFGVLRGGMLVSSCFWSACLMKKSYHPGRTAASVRLHPSLVAGLRDPVAIRALPSAGKAHWSITCTQKPGDNLPYMWLTGCAIGYTPFQSRTSKLDLHTGNFGAYNPDRRAFN